MTDALNKMPDFMVNRNLGRSIVVTGMHRSGTSWVGHVLASSGASILKDEEIFNTTPFRKNSPIQRMYEHVCDENESQYSEFIDAILSHNDLYSFTLALTHGSPLRDIGRFGKVRLTSWSRRLFFRNRPQILIEPIGLLSADWLSKRYAPAVVVLIRHPAAIASSLKRLGWTFNFSNFLSQRLLMEKHFSDFEDEMKRCLSGTDIVGQSALLWRLVYSVVQKYQEVYPNWVFVRHEDLSRNPDEEYRTLFGRIGIEFTANTQDYIVTTSSASNDSELPVGAKDTYRRNSLATISNWKKHLSGEEIARIRQTVQPIAERWYSETDWQVP